MARVNCKTEFDTYIHGIRHVAISAVKHGRMFQPLLAPIWLIVWMLENTRGSTSPNICESRIRIFNSLPNFPETNTAENHTERYYYVQAIDVIFILAEIKRRST